MAEDDGRRSAGVDGTAVPLANGGAGDRTAWSEQDGQRFEYDVMGKKEMKSWLFISFSGIIKP